MVDEQAKEKRQDLFLADAKGSQCSSLLISVYGREAGKSGLRSAGITLVFYFLNFIATLWESLGFTQVVNPFHYYQPQKLMFGEQSFAANVAVLLPAVIFFYIVANLHFSRRDIP